MMSKISKEKVLLLFFFIATQLFLNCSPRHANQLAIRQQTDYGKIRIYTWLDTLKFRDENFKDEVKISYLKIDLEEATLSYANETFLEGSERKEPNFTKLFKNKAFNYYLVTSASTFEIPKSVTKHKRAWNDFATPRRSVTRAKKYTVSGNTVRLKNSQAGSSHVFDSLLTLKANAN